MRLTFLGTGSAMPTGRRFQSGTLLVNDEDAILVDCGSGVLHALANTEVGYERVDAVLLTHHHLDHLADLLPLMKARWLAGATELTVAGPPGTERLVRDLLSVHEYMQDRLELTLYDVGTDFSLAGFAIESMETRHSMQCFAYRITPAVSETGDEAIGNDETTIEIGNDGTTTEGGDDPTATDTDREASETAASDAPTVVCSGDSEAFPELVAFADGATVLVHDCSFPDDVDVSNHPTPSALGAALAAADPDVDRVYLTHLYPHTDGRHEEMLESIADRYDGDVRFASDGLTLTLRSDHVE